MTGLVHVQRKIAELWTHGPQSFCCGPQRETLEVLNTLLWWLPTRAQQQILACNRWCAPPSKKAMATRSPYSLPKFMFLDLPRDVIRSVAVSDCVSTPFALRPQHGTPGPNLPVICVRLMMMSRMNRILLEARAHDVSTCFLVILSLRTTKNSIFPSWTHMKWLFF